MEQILDGGRGGGHESRFRCGLPPMTPGQGAKSRRAGAFGVAWLRLENFSGGRLPAARSAHQTPAIATRRKNTLAQSSPRSRRPTRSWVGSYFHGIGIGFGLSWNSPLPPRRGPQGWDLPVLGDPSDVLNFRLMPRLSLDSDQKPAAECHKCLNRLG